MLKALDRCLPASLIGRVYALYSAVLLLFVLVDGWQLLLGSLSQSFY